MDSVVLWDRPETRVPIGIAVSDRASYRMADKKGDVMVAVEPRQNLVQIGADHQKPFFEWAEKELLPALREL